MDTEEPHFSALGSDGWLGADEYEPDSPLHIRATNFLKTAKWNVLADIASKHRGGMPCCYEDKFSIGHFNMVRRINFEDGVGYVARLRLPDEEMCAEREALAGLKVMEVEIASMKFFGLVSLSRSVVVYEPLHHSHVSQVQNVHSGAQGDGLQHCT